MHNVIQGYYRLLGYTLEKDRPIQPFYLKIGPNWPNRQCCLAGSSKTAPKILTFSIAMGANNSSYVKSIATYTPTFFGCTYYFRLSHGALVALIRECSHAACEHSY